MYDIVIGRNEADRKLFGTKGAVFLGKHYVKMGQTTSLSNKVYMDVTRSHVVFICGKRGSGKCLHGDTMITLSDGSLVAIKNLKNNDLDVLCLNKDLKIQESSKSDFYERTVNKILNVTLRSGKDILLTPEHPVLTINGWQPIKSLRAKDRIATPRIQPVFGELDVEEHKVKLIAYLVAGGNLGNGSILFTNADEKINGDFEKSVKSFDNKLTQKFPGKFSIRISDPSRKRDVSKTKRDSSGKFSKDAVFDKKNSLGKFLENCKLYPSNAGTKHIPQNICTLPKNKLALFLNRLFSCDGSIYRKKNHTSNMWEISYASKSKTLISQLHHLLNRFNIRARRKIMHCNTFANYELVIYEEGTYTFLQEIGFFGEKEKKQQQALREEPKKRCPNTDTIPREIWEIYNPEDQVVVGAAMKYKGPASLRDTTKDAPTRQKLQQIALIDNNREMLHLATSDIFWDEISEMQEMYGSFKVFDLTVPEHHNFVANDIIVHNSYTMGVVAEGISDLPHEVKQNISIIMLDTMGIYWTMKYGNEKEADLLREWGLESKGLDVVVYTPAGFFEAQKKAGVLTDKPFSIKPSELDPSDWCLTFEMNINSPEGVLIETVVNTLLESNKNFGLDEVIKAMRQDTASEQHIRQLVINKFTAAQKWGMFSKEGTPLSELVKGGQVTILDVSCYATAPGTQGLRALVIGLVAEKLFVQRMIARKEEEVRSIKEKKHFMTEKSEEVQKDPLVWLVVDEAHEFLPNQGETPASHPLIIILREGRQPGISLILATQQPGKIHTDVMTQSDIVISHRLTAKVDVAALGMLMQSYMREGLDKQLNSLPSSKGSAIIFDDNNERMYAMRIRPRITWHGGEAPTAMHESKKVFDF